MTIRKFIDTFKYEYLKTPKEMAIYEIGMRDGIARVLQLLKLKRKMARLTKREAE